MPSTLSGPRKLPTDIRRVALLFAGGPAPAANAVISTCAASFLRNDVTVLGIQNGYQSLLAFEAGRPLQAGRDFIELTHAMLRRTRNSQGILVGTSRANPGSQVSTPEHFADAARTAPLRAVYDALRSIETDALVSIGGDDTLKTANKLKLYQDRLPPGTPRIPIVHVPKTIDNDYEGIDFTFGYFTAVEVLGTEIRNLLYDAEATRGYFLCETMGRTAGWLAYGAAIAGEASLVIGTEDIEGGYAAVEAGSGRRVLVVDQVVQRIVKTMLAREAEGKEFGVIVLAEGLAEMMPVAAVGEVPRDEHGHISLRQVNLGKTFGKLVADAYKKATGKSRVVRGLQLGYEARCEKPHAFDVILGSQLGVGAYRALVEQKLDGVMVSVTGQLELRYVPFARLVDPETLVTVVRRIHPDSDFHRLARFLETYVNE
jgi:6-phosphofructokinase 1